MENSIRRTLFASQNPYRRLDMLWRHRVRCLVEGLDYLRLTENPKIILHLLPAGEENFLIDRENHQIMEVIQSLPLLFGRYPHYHRVNIDGFLGCAISDNAKDSFTSYYQLFWDGSVEYVNAEWLGPRQENANETHPIHLPHFEYQIVENLKRIVSVMQRLSIPLPLRVYLAMMNAQGYRTIASRYQFPENRLLDRNELFFEPALLNTWEDSLPQALKPMFDQLWNAGGYLRSLSYQPNGDWKPDLR